MRVGYTGSRGLLFGSLMLLGVPIGGTTAAEAHTYYYRGHVAHYRYHYARAYARLQCVPFARADSGVEIKGNANTWWNQAEGVYQRGQRPEPGSVLSFSATSHMRLGHVAVVSRVVNAREIEIDHANWWGPGSYGGVTRNVPVVDVSENNDWTSVRVALGDGQFGSTYPTHGFIYDRPDNGKIEMASASSKPTPVPVLDPAPADLAPRVQTAGQVGTDGVILTGPISYDEVAEAPDDGMSSLTGGHRWRVVHRHVVQHVPHTHVVIRHWSVSRG